MDVKFRGKAIRTGEWVYGDKYTDQVFKNGESCVDVTLIRDECHQDHEVHPDSVGMWTGKSKWEEGKRVLDYYENDIIEVMIYDLRRKNFVVEDTGPLVWNSNGFYCKGDSGKWQRPNFDNIRVIGNATDNPELLK